MMSRNSTLRWPASTIYSTALATSPDIGPPGSSSLSRDMFRSFYRLSRIEGGKALNDLDLGQSSSCSHRPCSARRGISMTGNYSVTEQLRDGRGVEIRALRPDDKDDMLAAVGRTGVQSLQRRFFVAKRGFSDREIAFFMNIDFVNHVALAALAEEDG